MAERIEKLDYYSTAKDGCEWVLHPTEGDIVDKINELIDYLNTMME